MSGRLDGKVAIVTGAGASGPGMGNGKASAIVYAREGAKVMLVDYKVEAAKDTESIIRREGGESVVFQADVSRAPDCQAMVKKCMETYEQVDILHNNVGIAIPHAGGVVDVTEEDWDKVMLVNLKSMFLTCKYTLPYLEKSGRGAIINISSFNAIMTPPALQHAYAASKAGIIGFTKEIAVEYASRGVRANVILPGFINTPMARGAASSEAYGGQIEAIVSARDAMCPTGKQGEPWDVAYAALFLASDEAKYITGETLTVDGGLTKRVR